MSGHFIDGDSNLRGAGAAADKPVCRADLARRARSMVTDLEVRIEGTSGSVQAIQGMIVAEQFRAQATAAVAAFGRQQQLLESAPLEHLQALYARLNLAREALIEAMDMARGATPSAWRWPRWRPASQVAPATAMAISGADPYAKIAETCARIDALTGDVFAVSDSLDSSLADLK